MKRRVEQGELDECPLTLKDLTKIKEAFVNVLVGIYHTRLKYPEVEPRKRVRRPPGPRRVGAGKGEQGRKGEGREGPEEDETGGEERARVEPGHTEAP